MHRHAVGDADDVRGAASFRSRVQATPVWAVGALRAWAEGARADTDEGARRERALQTRGLTVRAAGPGRASRRQSRAREARHVNQTPAQRGRRPYSVAWAWVQVHASADADDGRAVLGQHETPGCGRSASRPGTSTACSCCGNLRRAWQRAIDRPYRADRLQRLPEAELLALANARERARGGRAPERTPARRS